MAISLHSALRSYSNSIISKLVGLSVLMLLVSMMMRGCEGYLVANSVSSTDWTAGLFRGTRSFTSTSLQFIYMTTTNSLLSGPIRQASCSPGFSTSASCNAATLGTNVNADYFVGTDNIVYFRFPFSSPTSPNCSLFHFSIRPSL